MALKDKLAGLTKGLGETPQKPQQDGAAAPAATAPARPRTGPGQMLAVRHLMGESAAEVAQLREKLEAYAGSVPARPVDPSTVGVSAYANRHEDEFTSKDFAALREDIEHAKKNIQPILVRQVKGRGKVVYEVIYGHRRLRACQDLKLPVWIIVVEATDEELFYAMDMENRQRKNPSPFELGDSYRRALESELFSSLRTLAARLKIDPGYASRAYNIAKLPPEVLDAFPSRTEIQFKWGKELSDALQKDPEGVIERAKAVKVGGTKLTSPQVLQKLLGKAANESAGPVLEIQGSAEKSVGRIEADAKGNVTVKLAAGIVPKERLAALQDLLTKFVKG
jgi:ParB family chromosome partitioning protein